MSKACLLLSLLLTTACDPFMYDATVVAIQDNPGCTGQKMTVLDVNHLGRIKRCGVWGVVGEKFTFNAMTN